MKNSTLIFRSMTLIGSVLFTWFYPIVVIIIFLIALVLGIFAYVLFCFLELDTWKTYSDEEFEYTIIPRKYNFITIFIDWVNSFPPIIKKKDLEK